MLAALALPLACLVALAASPARADDQTILGSSIQVKNPGAAAERTLSMKAREKESTNTLVGDPTLNGATVNLRMDGVGGPVLHSFSLPQGISSEGKHFWNGDPLKGYRYRDPNGEQGPVADAQIKASSSGQFSMAAKLSGENASLEVVPLSPSTGACFQLEIVGGDSYSVSFSGGELRTTDTSFSQKKVTTEASCSPSCSDGMLNQDETDVDCGGVCPNCGEGGTCGSASDCESGVCFSGVCIFTACGDGVVEGFEACDDGNTDPCDGCSPSCEDESAYTYAGTGLPLFVPDNLYTGTLGSMTCVNIAVPAAGDTHVDYVCPGLGMDHTWLGDLVVKLVSPSATTITLMSRAGRAELADDGLDGPSRGVDLVATHPIRWVDGASDDAESIGDTLLNAQAACRDDGRCVFAPNHGAAAAGDLSTLVGEAGTGTWKLCVSDASSVDTGVIQSVQLIVAQ